MIIPPDIQTVSLVSDHYDELDWFYRDTWGESLHHGYWKEGPESPSEAVHQLRDEIANLAEIEPGSRVCDIGCGYGAAARHWAETRRAHLTGITISRLQWAAAVARNLSSDEAFPSPDFHHRDWLENGLASCSFDSAVSIECLSHVGDKARFFSEATRVLKPGGILALTAWTAREGAPRWAERWLLEPICREGRFAGLATRIELIDLVSESGLALEIATDIGPRVKKTWLVIFRRLVMKVMTRREYRAFLWKQLRGDRRLLFTVPRVWLAFETGMLGYVMLRARKPSPPGT